MPALKIGMKAAWRMRSAVGWGLGPLSSIHHPPWTRTRYVRRRLLSLFFFFFGFFGFLFYVSDSARDLIPVVCGFFFFFFFFLVVWKIYFFPRCAFCSASADVLGPCLSSSHLIAISRFGIYKILRYQFLHTIHLCGKTRLDRDIRFPLNYPLLRADSSPFYQTHWSLSPLIPLVVDDGPSLRHLSPSDSI